jgi:hypothetical protein
MIADKGSATPLSESEMGIFLHQFLEMPITPVVLSLLSMEQNFDLCDIAWWLHSQDGSSKHSNCKRPIQHAFNIRYLFSHVHSKVGRNVVSHHMHVTHSLVPFLVQLVSKMSPCLQVH